MDKLLKNKVCIVTGASRGIGKSITQLFAEEGAVVFALARNIITIQEWLEKNTYRYKIYPIKVDIRCENEIKEAIERIKKDFKNIDVLVNNAAVEYNELIGMISKEHMNDMFQTNVFGLINILQYCARIMKRQKAGGSIINISSIVGLRGNKGQLVYSATKGAVISITKSAAKELACNNIRVNAVAPGLTNTDMVHATDYDKLQERISNIGMNRLAEPCDIAKTCLFLASDLSSYISGQVIAVDGCTII